MSGVLVQLTLKEQLQAGFNGVMRQIEAQKRNAQAYYGAGNNDDWQLSIEGCLGECALAKYLGWYWSGTGEYGDADVVDVDVRTAREQTHSLILHDKDPDDRVFWLVCGKYGTYYVKGWIHASQGKRSEFWKDPAGGRPAYFVPQSALNPPNTFEGR